MSGRPLRVEMITPTLEMGGMERLIVSMADAYRAEGHDVQVTALQSSGTLGEEAARLGIPVSVVRTPGLRTNLWAPALAAHFHARRLDVVHAHSGVWLKAARAARAAGVPGVVHTFHGIVQQEPWYNDVMRRMASWSTDTVVAVSDTLAQRLVTRAGVDSRKVQVIINGVDTRRFAPGDARTARDKLGLAPEAFVVGHVARLDPIKNQGMLLRALAALRATVPTACLVIIGDGAERGHLTSLAGDLGLGDAVRFAGEIRDAAPLYRAFDVFALSSVLEGTSMSILEAMASGIPVVATAVGGTPALLRQGAVGRLVPEGDHAALAAALAELHQDPALGRDVAAKALSMVHAEYSERAMLDRYLAIYRQAATAGANR